MPRAIYGSAAAIIVASGSGKPTISLLKVGATIVSLLPNDLAGCALDMVNTEFGLRRRIPFHGGGGVGGVTSASDMRVANSPLTFVSA